LEITLHCRVPTADQYLILAVESIVLLAPEVSGPYVNKRSPAERSYHSEISVAVCAASDDRIVVLFRRTVQLDVTHHFTFRRVISPVGYRVRLHRSV
jgi:hypothetical protein